MIRNKAQRRDPKPPVINPQQPASNDAGSGTATDPKKGQMGEGSYEGTRDYQKSIHDYLDEGSVQDDARAAKPRSKQEAADMERAEQVGRSHSHAPGK